MKCKVFGPTREYEMYTWSETVLEGTDMDLSGEVTAAQFLRELDGPLSRAGLKEILSAVLCSLGSSALSDTALQARLCPFLVNGMVRVRVLPQIRYLSDIQASERMDRSEEDDRSEKTWVEVVLVGEDGKPVPGIRYQIKLPDGSLHEGTFPASGSVRFNGITAGTCEVTFPDLDQDFWGPR